MKKLDLKEYWNFLNSTEIYTVGILMIYTILAALFFNQVANPLNLIFGNLFIVLLIVLLPRISGNFICLKYFRKFYLIPFIYFIYNQVHAYIVVINPYLFDNLLIKMDYALFGLNPTDWTWQFATPILTEYLQFCYMLFFFMPIAHGIELHFRKMDYEYSIFTRQILLGFYVSYLLYFFLPAIGPRFCLYDFYSLSKDLPGLWLADAFRNFINSGGGVPAGVSNAADFVNRDCMPSGHTMLTLMNIWLSFKFKSKMRYIFLVLGSSLIFSTIYLRYHYFVDVLAGALFAIIVFLAEPYIHRFIESKQSKK